MKYRRIQSQPHANAWVFRIALAGLTSVGPTVGCGSEDESRRQNPGMASSASPDSDTEDDSSSGVVPESEPHTADESDNTAPLDGDDFSEDTTSPPENSEEGAKEACHEDAGCHPELGTLSPFPVCSAAEPCTEAREPVTTASDVPACGRFWLSDGPPLTWTDSNGLERYSCVFTPSDAGPINRRPLIIWLHGGYDDADSVYDATNFRAHAEDYVFENGRVGFVLASVQGRNLRWAEYTGVNDGRAHDFLHWDLASPSANPDVAHLDALIDRLVASGAVDPDRIHLMGWSAGGFMSQLYGIARHETPTPGGNYVASVAVYSAANPFASLGGCARDPQPPTLLPIFTVGRDCDIVLCTEAHADVSVSDDPLGMSMNQWVDLLELDFGNSAVERLILDRRGNMVDDCAPASQCTRQAAELNHIRWVGPEIELQMLGFLNSHPR